MPDLEALRDANIQRNRKAMNELGIERSRLRSSMSSRDGGKKRKRNEELVKEEAEEVPLERRWSSRLQGGTPVNYREVYGCICMYVYIYRYVCMCIYIEREVYAYV
jgi:hypothetical protein